MTQKRLDRPTEAELARRQLHAVEAWNRARRITEDAVRSRTGSREMRMDLTRRLDVLREQHRMIVERTQKQLDASARLLARDGDWRAVIVHRNEWFSRKLSVELARRGIDVIEALQNGAEGVGAVVAEQPDLLVVEDTLPMVPGEEVVRETRQFSPTTTVVAQVAYDDRVRPLLDAGAHAAYPRRVPLQDIAAGVADLFRAEREPNPARV